MTSTARPNADRSTSLTEEQYRQRNQVTLQRALDAIGEGLPLTTVLLSLAEAVRRAEWKIDPDLLTQIVLFDIEARARLEDQAVRGQETYVPIIPR